MVNHHRKARPLSRVTSKEIMWKQHSNPHPITIAHQTGTDFYTIRGKKCNRNARRSLHTNKKKNSLKTAIYLIQILSDSISTCGREGIADPNQQKEHSIFTKKIRLPATYRNPNRKKLFACSYCTMKFAKAINLYKHLKVKRSKYAMPPFYSWTASECVRPCSHITFFSPFLTAALLIYLTYFNVMCEQHHSNSFKPF